MVQEIFRRSTVADFPPSAPAANPVFFRTYSRQTEAGRESWEQVCDRTVAGIAQLGQLTSQEEALISRMQRELKTLTSGRWLWIGGTNWIEQRQNFSGGYNCTSTNVTDWRAFALMMDLAMMGCGTGAVLEPKYIEQLPPVRNPIALKVQGEVGVTPALQRREETEVIVNGNQVVIHVGDSRHGWVKSYQTLLELCSDERFEGAVEVLVDMSDVRPAGETLKGFGGMANPVKLPDMYARVARILNQAIGRQLNSVECCLLIDEAAVTIVAGNIRRCLPEDALVHTDHGLVPIREIQVGDRVQTPLGFRRVLDKFDQGFQEVHEIETNGPSPRATLNHRMAVYGDATGTVQWKRVGELVEGDRLLHNCTILPGTVTELPPDFTQARPEQSRTIKPLRIPPLTPEVAWLIGFTHGDGYVALGRNKHDKPYGRVEWAMNGHDFDLLPQLQNKIDIALELFGLRASHGTVKGENTAKAICSSIRLAEYFHQYIKQPKQPLTIPSFILQGSVDVRAAYLAGLMDSDGAVNNRPPHLLTSVYRDFVRQVTALLSSLGIAGRISITRPEKSHWQLKYNLKLPALKDRYNALIAPHSVKGSLRQGLKAHGFTFTGAMMREAYTYSEMRGMGFEGSRTTDSNYERYVAQSSLDLDIPVTMQALGSHDHVKTYDIEVEEAHCFYCDGYLTHNSAGMRQFDSNDQGAAGAKENLWQQDAQGNWRIDPERDALRMANHTRVFHRKPTKEETFEAVRKQFYSGEGAIQYAPEAIARANADLLTHPDLKQEFLGIYDELGIEEAKTWIRQYRPEMSDQELEHRFQRYGLNPCVTADTWVHTEHGPRQVKDLLGVQHSTYINGELFSTTAEGFFYSGTKSVVRLQTQEGFELRLTANHQLLKVSAQTQKAQYSEWVEAGELQVGDRVLIHNHRGLQPWIGKGSEEEGWLLGSLVGDGSLADNITAQNRQVVLRYWGESQVEMAAQALERLEETQLSVGQVAVYHKRNGYLQVASANLRKLADEYGIVRGHKTITAAVEQTSYEFYQGFLRGLFDADGSVQGQQQKGVSIRLAQSNLPLLQAAQRMLLRLGIASTIDQAQHELVISNDNIQVFAELIGFSEPQKSERLSELLGSYRRQPNRERFAVRVKAIAPAGIEPVYDCTVPGPARFDANGFVAHNCGEIIGANFHCNLSEVHLNQLDPNNEQDQVDAFRAGALSVAALLNHQFIEDRYRESRELDPIVGVSFTGLFDFFVHALGTPWLEWWVEGRPETEQGLGFKAKEAAYLNRWREVVHSTIWDYCDRHNLHRPNRCTTVQPAGCLDRTALRIFDQGLLYADEIIEPGSGETEGLDLSVRGGIAADTAIANQPLRLIKVTLKNGRILRMTPNHRLSIQGQWVRADELQTGLDIDYSIGEYKKQEDALLLSLDPLQYSREERKQQVGHGRGVLTQEILTPTTLNPEIGYFLGCLLGDGAMSEGKCRIRFAFNAEEADLVERLQAIAQRWFGITGTVHYDPRNHNSRGELVFASRQLFDWLQLNRLGKTRSTELDRIPQAIRRSSQQTILSFFCGLIDTDGCVRKQGALSIDSASEAFIRNLQQVGEAVGLCCSIFHNTQGENLQGTKNMWGLCLSRMLSSVDALAYLNAHSRKCGLRPLFEPKRQFAFHPYRVEAIAFETVPDYSYDFAVAGVDDDDSWYWQGALKSHNTKSLLTGASSGWHPPKAQRFIRRITFRKNDPVAMACIDYGYQVVPSQSDKDEHGNLLNDPFDPRCTEWLVEIPTEVSWANLPGADTIDISQFSALAQFDFYMQVQKHYTTHNTSATVELREAEIEPLAERIYRCIETDEGYMSAALLARFDDLQTFPRLPFEPIDKQTYEQMLLAVKQRRDTADFLAALKRYDSGPMMEAGPAGCDSDKCLLPEKQPE